MVLNLIFYLLPVFVYENSSVLEHSVLNLNVVKQTVCWVKVVEKLAFVLNWHSLPWNVTLVYGTGA